MKKSRMSMDRCQGASPGNTSKLSLRMGGILKNDLAANQYN